MNTTAKTISVISVFSVAMAALESAVVVYLRALYYPEGFTVAFKIIDEKILLIELMREAATVLMLLSVGFLAGKDLKSRMAYFLLSFAVWDIFYYGWLKVFINWPLSLFEWDILFLIPFTWLGPVLAPIICSVTMILLAMALLFNDRDLTVTGWSLLLSGCALILYTFMADYGTLIIGNGFLSDYATLIRNEDFLSVASAYTPAPFNWTVFGIGELLLLAGIFSLAGRRFPMLSNKAA
ncbi:MAG TPA: hypothetical protein VFO54_02305 [Chryseosolibacter sp.]|nr:hypothetical protein [Chryseosolibacter sp.]